MGARYPILGRGHLLRSRESWLAAPELGSMISKTPSEVAPCAPTFDHLPFRLLHECRQRKCLHRVAIANRCVVYQILFLLLSMLMMRMMGVQHQILADQHLPRYQCLPLSCAQHALGQYQLQGSSQRSSLAFQAGLWFQDGMTMSQRQCLRRMMKEEMRPEPAGMIQTEAFLWYDPDATPLLTRGKTKTVVPELLRPIRLPEARSWHGASAQSRHDRTKTNQLP